MTPRSHFQRTVASLSLEASAFFIFALAGFWVLALTVHDALSLSARPFGSNEANISRGGGVASLDKRCSFLGREILEKGGNAADAMITTQLCLGVIGMHSTGIGGGGFMLVRDSNGSYEFIDFRETAPATSYETMYDNNLNASKYGGLASGVPGELRGLEYLHTKYGSLPWKDLLEPAIGIANYGFTVGPDLNYYMDGIHNDALFLSPSWAPDFAPTGKRVNPGQPLSRKRYADVLQAVSDNGVDAFYTGPIARATIAALQAANGTMTMEDLSSYRVVVRTPKSIDYRGYRLISGGAPSGGIVALSILKTFERFEDVGDPQQINLTTHRLDEAMRFAYGARTMLGDPAFVYGMNIYEHRMISGFYAAKIGSKIIDDHTQPVATYKPDGIESLETRGASHVAISDASGMAVSLTSTVNLPFGSQLMVPETGIIMNNAMNDFSVPNSTNAFGFIPSPANSIKPGKRPLSSISPIIVEYANNNTLHIVMGADGGSRIITTAVQGIWNIIDRDMNAYQAVVEPRFHDQLVPNEMMFESAFDHSTIADMEARGHKPAWLDHRSDLQIVRRLSNGTFEAASDPRQVESGAYAVMAKGG